MAENENVILNKKADKPFCIHLSSYMSDEVEFRSD